MPTNTPRNAEEQFQAKLLNELQRLNSCVSAMAESYVSEMNQLKGYMKSIADALERIAQSAQSQRR